jgi:N-acetylmuramoyl-L-alanine amidase
MVLFATNQLKEVKIVKGELRLKFSDTIEKKNIRTFTLTKPYRKVFDIRNCRLADRKVGRGLKSPTTRFLKVAQYKPDIVRVVIGYDAPYHCTPYKPILSKNRYHIPLPKKRIHLPATRYTKQAAKAKKKLSSKKAKARKLLKPSSYFRHKELIVIDAGHGGHDTGAIAGGKREKDLVLQIAKRLEKELKKRGYRVYMTRRTDRFLKLPQRTHIADKKGATVFVSIHANSVPKSKRNRVYGIETFFLQNTRDAKSKRIAARENAAVLKGAGSSLSKKVIVDAVLNGPKIIESNKLAIDVQKRMMVNLRAHYDHIKDGGVRHAPFWVLVGASRPSILVEVGYISHPRERKRLFSSRYQTLLAKGIAEGIDNYLLHRHKELGF